MWETFSSTRVDAPRKMDFKTVQVNISHCSFVRLVLYAPHDSGRNQSQEVVLEDIEIFGMPEDASHQPGKSESNLRAIAKNDDKSSDCFNRAHRSALLSPDNDNSDLQAVLLDAGVPMRLVAQIDMIPDRDVTSSPSQKSCETSSAPPEVAHIFLQENDEVPESSNIPTALQIIPSEDINQDEQPKSPFDQAIRQYMEQTAREKAVLRKIFVTEIDEGTDEISLWQSPSLPLSDAANTNEVAVYTFGAYFTQSILCGGSDIQITCFQVVERYVPFLKDAIGATFTFEGVVAIIVIGVREAKSSHVFRAAIHLAHTVFLSSWKSDSGNNLKEFSTAILDLVEELDPANVSYGLQSILESTLASPFCWSTNHTSNPQMLPTIDKSFLQFIRLLVEQDLTRSNFFEELLALTPADSSTGTICTVNRLRLLRLVLRDEMTCCKISTKTETSIRSLCTVLLTLEITSHGATCMRIENHNDKEVIMRLAEGCLDKIDGLSSSQETDDRFNPVQKLLTSVHRRLQASSGPNNYHSHRYKHAAFFVENPVAESQIDELAKQMQRYFAAKPRPKALYRHKFVRATRIESENYERVPRELFHKGNITFQGQVVPRIPPKETFHEEIQRKTAPFVFEIDSSNIHNEVTIPQLQFPRQHDIVSSFAVFQGTIEQRRDIPTKKSQVFPQDQIQTLVNTKTLTMASKQMRNKAISPITVDTLSDDAAYAGTNIPIQSANSTKPVEVGALMKPAIVTKQIISYQPNQHKNEAKVKNNRKRKSKGKSAAKSADSCLLQ